MALRVIFMGTPDFSVPTLSRIVADGHQVVAVYTRAPKPAGRRGLELRPSPIHVEAERLNLSVYTPKTLRTPEMSAQMASHGADVGVVVAYGLILPLPILNAPRLGCLNLHASLLPRWRGAAPIQRAVEAGDAQSGVCIMQMEEGLDTGPVWWRQALSLSEDETSASLHDKLADLGAKGIVQTLAQLSHLSAAPQPEEGITYAAKIDKQEALMDWSLPASALARRIRAFDPFPGAHTLRHGQPLKIWSAQVLPQDAAHAPGTVVQASEQGLDVACGEGVLRLLQLQKPGGKRLTFAELLRGQVDWQDTVLGH
jgi:methionyl-tRNA formyltransferase